MKIVIENAKRFRIIMLLFIVVITGCVNNEPAVNQAFVDSLDHFYVPDSLISSNERNRVFWLNRIRPQSVGNINEVQYATTLVNSFKLKGDIRDLRAADSILRKIDTAFAYSLPGPLMSLVSVSIMHHRFAMADTFFRKALDIGIKAFQRNSLGFDVSFELGRYGEAKTYLHGGKSLEDFNYYFRRSKYDHLMGNADSAYTAMKQALSLAGTNPYLLNLVWSALGDLSLHQGNLETAANALKQAIRINAGDMHSLLNLGWISLMRDHDTTVAGKLFRLAITRNQLPDPYYKLYQMAQWSKDSVRMLDFAKKFETLATAPGYERMYSKYLIELYATVLHQPQTAEAMAFAELSNRATPQTYAWYAYAMLCNNKNEQAYQVFQQHIAGKPLEGVELYYAGKILSSIGHGFDAGKCFEAALQNRYDLSPYMVEDIERLGDPLN